jgi:hypothetical protein
MMLSTNAFDRVKGFPDLRAAEDQIFFNQIERGGLVTVWAPGAVAYWQLPRSIPATFRRFRLYSRQNVLVGRQRHWHYGVARMYAVAIAIAGVAFLRNRRLLILLPLGAAARSVHRLSQHRETYGTGYVFNPLRVVGTVILTLVIDAATFNGWVSASGRRFRRRRHRWDRGG